MFTISMSSSLQPLLMGLYAIIRIFVETAVENTIPITPEECKQVCGVSCRCRMVEQSEVFHLS